MIILIEGPDGSGKSTLVKELAQDLESTGLSVKTFAFPSHTGPIGQFIRHHVFTGNIDIAENAMLPLMVADAIDCDGAIAGYAEQFDIVIIDRHSLVSAWAYQLEPWGIEGVSRFVSPGMFRALPDLVFILDIPADEAMKRREGRSGEVNHLYEKDLAYARQLRDRYLAFAALNAGHAPVMVLDALRATDEIVETIRGILAANEDTGEVITEVEVPTCNECGHPATAHGEGGCTISSMDGKTGKSVRCDCNG